MASSKLSRKYSAAILVVSTVLALAACQKKDEVSGAGPAEQMGRKLDQATDKAGKELTRAAQDANQQISDAARETSDKINKATGEAGQKLDQATEAAGKKLEQAGEKMQATAQERARERETKK